VLRKKLLWCRDRIKKSSKVVGLGLVIFALAFRLELYPYNEMKKHASDVSIAAITEGRTIIPSASLPYVSSVIDDTLLRLRLGSSLENVGETPIIIVDTHDVNAYALPDGRIVVTLGILAKVKKLPHLAGILGHEMGHLENKDFRDQVVLQSVLIAVCLLAAFKFGILMGLALTPIVYLINRLFQRQCEYRADDKAVEMLVGAGYNKSDFATFLGTRISQESYIPPLDDIRELSRSHPVVYKRALRILSTR